MTLKQLRVQKNWSQEDLAELSGLSVRTIQRIESGHKAGLDSLKSIAAAFNIDIAQLREELKRPEEESVTDEAYAENVILFYATAVGGFLSLIFIFLPNALQDSSNWGPFGGMCILYLLLQSMFAWETFGSSWKAQIITRRKRGEY